ncbi:MAG: hypothetical protein MK052_10485 [Alphaproteobacteria bacterium]|nr:hypothetical protein [Alphaproteobacteria bacterium]
MTTFSWGKDSSIQKMQIQPFGKGKEAILYAAEGAKAGELANVPDMLHSFGMTAVPSTKDGQHVLCVRGFKKSNDLASALEQNEFVKPDSRETVKSPKEPKSSFKPLETLRQKSLPASGYVYLVGDAALVASGIKRRDINEFMTGAAFSSSSVVLARYGEKKVDKVFDKLHDKMLSQFAKEGIEIPEDMQKCVQNRGRPHSILGHIENFLYEHPAEVNAAVNSYAGFQMFKAGMNLSETDKSAGRAKSIAGALVASGMMTSLLVPEKQKKSATSLDDASAALDQGANVEDIWKKPVPEDEKDKGVIGTLLSPVQMVTDWVQEKPLRVGGYMAMANNVFQGSSAFLERKNGPQIIEDLQQKLIDEGGEDKATEDALQKAQRNKNNWMFNMPAAVAYMEANGLLAISSKDNDSHAKSDKDPFDELYAASAALLANQPKEVQDTMVKKMSEHLAEEKAINHTAEEISQLMHIKLENVQASPWLQSREHEKTSERDKKSKDSTPQSWAEREEINIPDTVPEAWVQKEAERARQQRQKEFAGVER